MTSIEGVVLELIYKNEENGYTVLEADIEGELVTVVGIMPYIQPGESVRFFGDYTEHKTYGTQFKAVSYETSMPMDTEGMELFLSSGLIKGVGAVMAHRIVSEFGVDTFEVIEHSFELLANIKGISAKMARSIHDCYIEHMNVRHIIGTLAKYDLTTKQAIRIYEQYGPDADKIIENNPYQLMDDVAGFGFERADKLAKLLGFERHSPLRIQSMVKHILKLALKEGHTCVPLPLLKNKCMQLTDIGEDDLDNAIARLTISEQLVMKNYGKYSFVFLMSAYLSESSGGLKLLELKYSAPKMEVALDYDLLSQQKLSEEQERGVIASGQNMVTVITGGPGTGKTTMINAMIKLFENSGLTVALAAPTGRAAKRMTQATGKEAKTIHRLLEYGAMEEDEEELREEYGRFRRNKNNPLAVEAVIIDEFSMVDIYLFHNLLEAIEPGTRLVIVGDADQLPSVGPGNVLKDIILSKLFCNIQLSFIYRQGGNIVLNAYRVNQGESIEYFESGEFVFKEVLNVNQCLNLVLRCYSQILDQNLCDIDELQVLCPVRRGVLGVEKLNESLKEQINPKSPLKQEIKYLDTWFRQGDKVMQTSNNYQKQWYTVGQEAYYQKGQGVFNGEIGHIVKIDERARQLTILFDKERQAIYQFDELDQIEHAYAVTIHKSQGSEFDYVIIPLLYSQSYFLTRNLLYTALTRAKKKVILLGSKKTVQFMIDNLSTRSRFSGLLWELKEYGRLFGRLSQQEKQ